MLRSIGKQSGNPWSQSWNRKKQTVRRGDLHRWDKIWREGVCRLFPATVTPHLCSGESWAEKTEQIEQRME